MKSKLEKPKQECKHEFVTKFGVSECQNCGIEESAVVSIKKQETLEEAMNQNGYHESDYDKIWRDGVKFGAKWQQERMYSEEDLKKAFREGQDNIWHSEGFGLCTHMSEEKWFNQFKKNNT